MKVISLPDLSSQEREDLLRELGYSTDGRFVLDAQGRRVKDRYTQKPVEVESMVILPGSTIILDDNPLSIASYFRDFGELDL